MSANSGTILIVDDERLNINMLVELLGDDYVLLAAKNGEQGLERARGEPTPDLILLDITMPGLNGYEVLLHLRRDEKTAEIPVIFVTAHGDADFETKGFELGAVDYIAKPFSPEVVRARVRTHLSLTFAKRELADQNRILEQKVAERTRELALTQAVTIHSLASLAETRDNETGNHIRRTQNYVRALAENLRRCARFRSFLDQPTIDLIYESAPLHDMGKVGVPDDILLKPGKLTDEEFEVMKTHTILGREAILRAAPEESNGSMATFLRFIIEIAHTHHEKWDGTGYPEGLKEEEIPISGRLMAIADVYDALISKRVYKPAFSHEKAVEIIREGAGQHFDPDMAAAFLEIEGEFKQIARQYADLQEAEEVKAKELS